jgi:CHAT domain
MRSRAGKELGVFSPHVLERVPLQWAFYSIASGRILSSFSTPPQIADPVSLTMDTHESLAVVFLAAAGYGKTLALRRVAARNGEALCLDDMDQTPEGVARFVEAVERRRQVVATVETAAWPSLREDLVQPLRVRRWRLRIIEFLPWETQQAHELIQARRAACDDPKGRLRLETIETLVNAGRLPDVFGDLPRCPLFLRLILDLVEESSLPAGRIGPARLVRDWFRRKLDGGDDEISTAAADLEAVGPGLHPLLQEFLQAWLAAGSPEPTPRPTPGMAAWTEALRSEGLLPDRSLGQRSSFSPAPATCPAGRHSGRQRLGPSQSVSLPDLEIRVNLEVESGVHRLQYVLNTHGQGRFFHTPFPGPVLGRHPEKFAAALRERIEGLGKRTGLAGDLLLPMDIRRELENLGRDLYQKLFPAEMRDAYRTFRRSVRSLQIVSNEPWIPWEWIRPYDDSDRSDLIDDDFLCLRFSLARWLTAAHPPAETVHVRRLAILEAGEVPGAPPLPHVPEERQFVAEWASRHQISTREISAATHPQAMAQLAAGQIDAFHFAGHGLYDPEQPEACGFLLADGRVLHPLDLLGPVQTRLKEARPLVFFNACQTARIDISPTGLEGWVPQWIRGCGCAALLGPQWNVNDRLALAFTRAFYTRLERGRTLGEAVRAARRALRRIDPNHPSWLAFVLYAQPNARTLLGPRQP